MRGNAVQVQNFQGGLDYRGPSSRTTTGSYPDDKPTGGHLRECIDLVCDGNGVLRRRAGITTSTNWSSRTYYRVQWMPGLQTYLLCATNGNYYATTSWGTAPTLISGLTGALTRWTEAPATGGQGPAYGTNLNTGVPVQWTGAGNVAAWTATTGANASWTYLGAVPAANYIAHFQSRVFLARALNEASTVWWSDVSLLGGGALPRVWPQQNVLRLDPQDGGTINGIIPCNAALLVFKQNRIYSIYDTETGANRTISATIGGIEGSYASDPQGRVYFLSPQAGPCMTDGRTVTRIGQAVQAAFENQASPSNFAAGAYIDGHYYLSYAPVSPITGNRITLDYDTEHGTWTAHSMVSQWFTVMNMLTNPPRLIGVDNTNSFLYQWFERGFTTDGTVGNPGAPTTPPTTFSAEAWLPWMDFGAPHLRKRLRRIRVTGRGGIDVLLSQDYDDTAFTAVAANGLGTGATVSDVLDVPINGRVGRSFGVKLRSDSASDANWMVENVTAAVTARQD